METAKLEKSKASPRRNQKRSWFYRILHWIRVTVLIFVAASMALVLLYRFVPPPVTPLMVLRLGEQGLAGKPLRLE